MPCTNLKALERYHFSYQNQLCSPDASGVGQQPRQMPVVLLQPQHAERFQPEQVATVPLLHQALTPAFPVPGTASSCPPHHTHRGPVQ